jgi:ERF superfamily
METKHDLPVLTPRESAEKLIAQAIEKNVPVETMERLLAMRTQLKGEYAEEQFNIAMANFQSECPTIKKTKIVCDKNNKPRYSYAPLESIVEQVKSLLHKNELSYSLNVIQDEKMLGVVCRVTHSAGHAEESTFSVPIGSEQYMSDVQKYGARLTFAKRYAFCNAFGILTGDEDTDAQPETDGTHLSTNHDAHDVECAQAREYTESPKDFDPTKEEITFGKNKGLRWVEVEDDYLRWMTGSDKGSPENKAKAKATLEYKKSIAAQVPDPLEKALGAKIPASEMTMPEHQESVATIIGVKSVKATPIEILKGMLNVAIMTNELSALEAWQKNNKDGINKLSAEDKENLRNQYNKAKKELSNGK